MAKRKYRVVHCGTGVTGRLGLIAILHHPDVELVGHLVFDPEKDGKDSGELCKTGNQTGVKATRDMTALIALKPDFLAFFGDGMGKLKESHATICRFLEAGVNVGTPALFVMSYPPTSDPELVKPIEQACARGNSSYYYTGSDPGFFSPTLAVAMLKNADEVNQVLMQEIANYAFYDVEWIMRDVFGFGKPRDYQSPLSDGTLIKANWTGTLNAIADRMGIKLEDHRPFFENATHDKTHQTLWGPVEAGTVAALRFGLQGIYQGQPLLVLEHVTRTTLDAAPHWPQAQGGDIKNLRHEYTVLIKGNPDIDCRVALGETRDKDDAGLVTTAQLVVNAVPIVTEHAPGIINEMDLPQYASRNIVV